MKRWLYMVRGRGACHHPDGAVVLLASALAVFDDQLQIVPELVSLDDLGFPIVSTISIDGGRSSISPSAQ